MIPKETIRISPFPRNSNGKTDRRALIDKFAEASAKG
jgi:hypothetical protein